MSFLAKTVTPRPLRGHTQSTREWSLSMATAGGREKERGGPRAVMATQRSPVFTDYILRAKDFTKHSWHHT